jgi:hypothetical protein
MLFSFHNNNSYKLSKPLLKMSDEERQSFYDSLLRSEDRKLGKNQRYLNNTFHYFHHEDKLVMAINEGSRLLTTIALPDLPQEYRKIAEKAITAGLRIHQFTGRQLPQFS